MKPGNLGLNIAIIVIFFCLLPISIVLGAWRGARKEFQEWWDALKEGVWDDNPTNI